MKSIALGAAVCVSAATLLWIGYTAVVEWQHAATLVAAHNSEAAADLLTAALARDMRGAQRTVLETAERDGLMAAVAADMRRPTASAFARYPYIEALFTWREQPSGGDPVIFLARAERYPAWLARTQAPPVYPVVIAREPSVGGRVIARAMQDGLRARRFSIFEIDIAGVRYQVVTLLSYGDRLREHVTAAIGFMVNLDWVRHSYFTDIVAQVALIEGRDRGVRFAVLDDHQAPVVGSLAEASAPHSHREFPLVFFDPVMVAVDPPPDLRLARWTALASAEEDPTLHAADRSARRTLALAAAMAATLALAFVLSLRAARTNANLATMRAEFVSAVTHELKAPIANLRAISDTLASGRHTAATTREYGSMGVREANRLARLVDNLLAYSRVADVADIYSFERISVKELVERTLREFAPNLEQGGFRVDVRLPDDLPDLHADPTALGLMLNNLVDNAIRYSDDRRELTIAATHEGRSVKLRITDRGCGIAAADIPRVTRRFFRGQGSHPGGSGLGLAIVDRIATDHGGSLEIDSAVGRGTTMIVTLPAA